MASDSTSNLLETIVARLKAYADDVGNTIQTLAGGRVYVSQAPDNVAAPYVVVRKINSQSDPEFGNLRELFDVEVEVHGRGRGTNEQSAELIADLAEQALLTWHESSSTLGLTFGQFSTRDTEPPDPDAATRDRATIHVLVSCASWSKRLANALT